MKYLISLCLLLLTGCGAFCNRGWDHVDSDRKMVRYPACTGLVAGSVVGVPATIVALPITYHYAKKSHAGMEIFIPWWICAGTGAEIFGEPFNLVFGERKAKKEEN